MNKLKMLSIVAVLLFLISCNNDEDKAREVAEKYLTAFINYDFDTAKQFGNENAAIFLDGIKQSLSEMPAEELAERKKQIASYKLNIIKVSIDKDTNKAKIMYQYLPPEAKNNSQVQVEYLYLVKVGNDWKADEILE